MGAGCVSFAAPILLRLLLARIVAQASTEVLFTLKAPSVTVAPAIRRWLPTMARTVTGSRLEKSAMRGLARVPLPATKSSSTVVNERFSVTTTPRVISGAAPERK